jgi:hypothetical protein
MRVAGMEPSPERIVSRTAGTRCLLEVTNIAAALVRKLFLSRMIGDDRYR